MPNYKVTFRVQTKRETLFCSDTEVVSGEDLQKARDLIGEILENDDSFISVLEEGGHEIFIPREEIATIIICKEEAEDE